MDDVTYIDPCDVSPNHYRELFTNEHLRVVEMSLPAGEKDNEHSHPNETVYFIKGGKVRIYVGTNTHLVHLREAQVSFVSAQ